MSNLETKSDQSKPKRTLNPIIKAMNDYRNNIIGEHIGSKAPKRTAPIFKVTLAAARSSLDIDESAKNSIAVVDKASELFSANPDKFIKLADKLEPPEPKKANSKKEVVEVVKESKVKKTKSTSKKEEVVEDIIEDVVEKVLQVKPTKGKSKKQEEEVLEVKQTKGKSKKQEEEVLEVTPTKGKSKKQEVVVNKKVKAVVKKPIVESESESDSESDSD